MMSSLERDARRPRPARLRPISTMPIGDLQANAVDPHQLRVSGVPRSSRASIFPSRPARRSPTWRWCASPWRRRHRLSVTAVALDQRRRPDGARRRGEDPRRHDLREPNGYRHRADSRWSPPSKAAVEYAADSGDSATFQALIAAQSAAVTDLNARAQSLPSLVTYSFGRVMTSHALGAAPLRRPPADCRRASSP